MTKITNATAERLLEHSESLKEVVLVSIAGDRLLMSAQEYESFLRPHKPITAGDEHHQ